MYSICKDSFNCLFLLISVKDVRNANARYFKCINDYVNKDMYQETKTLYHSLVEIQFYL